MCRSALSLILVEMTASPVELITRKRNAEEHTKEELLSLIDQFVSGRLADYQMSAWLMAVFLNGMSDAEMSALTLAMRDSGKRLSLGKVKKPKVDKHSTGGVGDKLSIPLAPLVACAGLAVPMISGRGLGHTGGTLDKLEAIPGYETQISVSKFESIVREVGASIMGQTSELAPADKRIYALRDVTGTVESRPLIVASILSKKLSAGLDSLLLDVKVGRGAFMKNRKNATALAKSLVQVANALGTRTSALLTDMDLPLGLTIGNGLEVEESIAILQGQGPQDSTELTLRLGAEMLLLGGLHTERRQAQRELERYLKDGSALERLAKMVRAHGADPRYITGEKKLAKAKMRKEVRALSSGYIQDIEPMALAQAALQLGAGRLRAEDRIDPKVGIELHGHVETKVSKGDLLAVIHTEKNKPNVEALVRSAFQIGREKKARNKLVLASIQ